jgi:hypothetical protein
LACGGPKNALRIANGDALTFRVSCNQRYPEQSSNQFFA